tara:strand:- start:15 stop:1172 length:1158 start_codon:yes stop_codon:yes gene_type:complete
MSLKVLQVIPRLNYGGAETGCYDLAHFLPEKGCKSYIITSGGKLLKFIKKDKVKVFRLPVHSKNPIIILLNTFLITLIVFFLNIDLVHARSRAPAWSCFFSCKITRRKFVTTFHGRYNFKSELKKFYNSVMVRSDLIIAGSNFIFDHINKNYSKYLSDEKKLLVIFRGINTDYFSNATIKNEKLEDFFSKNNLKTGEFKILLPGRITPWKGQDLFIEALNILRNQFKKENFHAIILGSSEGKKVYVKKLSSLVDKYQMRSKITFIPQFKEMPIIYYISDVVVSASVEPEAFGRVSVEAQAMEKPIIASDHGGSRETILSNKTGFLFKNNDINSLAEYLNKMIEMSKDELQLIGNEGRKNVLKKFDVEKMCQSTYAEYQKLFKDKK